MKDRCHYVHVTEDEIEGKDIKLPRGHLMQRVDSLKRL